MNDKIVNIVVQEDKSVKRLLKRTAKKFRRSLKKSNINVGEANLKPRRIWWQKLLSITLNFLSVIVLIFATTICVISLSNRVRNIPPSFAGFSTLTIESHSMENSGLYKDNSVVVSKVNASELKNDDIIAFYVYSETFKFISVDTLKEIDESQNLSADNAFSLKTFLGFQSPIIKEASINNSILVIHHIKEIYQDESGTIWFSTYGSSNGYTDEWLIREDLIIGKLNNSSSATAVAGLANFINNPIGLFLCIIIPLSYLIYTIITELLYHCAIKRLQIQVVNGDRLLTDIICVRNRIGYSLQHKKKLEVLAMAPQELKTMYLSLLWEDGSVPPVIRKHYLKKNILLGIYAEYNELDRTVMLMYKDNVNKESIAEYYIEKKNQIKQKENRYKKILKKIKLKTN